MYSISSSVVWLLAHFSSSCSVALNLISISGIRFLPFRVQLRWAGLEPGCSARVWILLAKPASSIVPSLPSGIGRAKFGLLDNQRTDVLCLEPAVVARAKAVYRY